MKKKSKFDELKTAQTTILQNRCKLISKHFLVWYNSTHQFFLYNSKKVIFQTKKLVKTSTFNMLKYNSVLKKDSVISLLGKTSLEEATYLLSLVDLVITNDSGLMHIAASVETNLISIFGSSSPFYTPPLIKNEFGEVIYKGLECSPCFKRECPLHHLDCLNDISSKEIFEKSIKYLR